MMNWLSIGAHVAAWFIAPIVAVSAWLGLQGGVQQGPMIPAPAPFSVACTMEAKLCPDGSYVGRVGPDCAFAPCPGVPQPLPQPIPAPQPAASITIYSMTPQSGPVGTEVTIDGFGFTNDNTIHFGSGVVVHVPISSSIAIACTTDPACKGGIHQTLKFTVPNSLNPACYYSNPRCLIVSRETTPGKYNVFVTNSNGTSKTMLFVVTGVVSTSPHIDSISPSSGVVGTQVTLNGSGFSQDMVVRFDGGSVAHDTSADGTQISFNIPESIGAYCTGGMMCPMYMRLVTPGTYQIFVQNADGTAASNTVDFSVTDGSTGGSSVSINGLDAPSTLALGQSGTWTVHVGSSSLNQNLHYSVLWGDETFGGNAAIMAPEPTTVQTSATFTHAYQRSGSYTATFTVSDDSGHSASVSSTIIVTPLY